MGKAIIRLFIALFFTTVLHLPTGLAQVCEDLFSDRSAGIILNARLAAKYPSLAFVIENPDAFLATMRARFEAQKHLTPDEPHRFDYSEVGLPVLQSMSTALTQKITELSARQPRSSADAKELAAGVEYLRALAREVDGHLERGRIDYREINEVSYFFSRAIGHFDTKTFTLVERILLTIDRHLNGYRQLSIAQEYAMYRERRFVVFQQHPSFGGFKLAHEPFERAFQNKERLETVWVPIAADVGTDILMRLMTKNINLIGVTATPVLADGILRPGGDFRIHDVRHESAKFQKLEAYLQQNKLTQKQTDMVLAKSERWLMELQEASSKITDKELRSAVRLLAFNFHHDRGFPIAPSAFLARPRGPVIYFLYFMMKIAGQKMYFTKPFYNLKRADRWLAEFWSRRQAEESEVLNAVQDSLP